MLFRKFMFFELKKFLRIKNIVIYLGIVLVVSLLYSYIIPNEKIDNWKKEANNKLSEYEMGLSEINVADMDDVDKAMYNVFEQEILKIRTSLDKDIPYNVQSVWSFIELSSKLLSGLVILSIILAVNAIKREYKNNMWEKLLCVGIDRKKLLLSKIISVIIINIMVLFSAYIIVFLVGIIRFGNFSSVYYLKFMGDSFLVEHYFKVILKTFIHTMAVMFLFSSAAMLFQIIINNELGITLGMSLLFLLNSPINNLLVKVKIDKFLPFAYINKPDSLNMLLLGGIYMCLLIVLGNYCSLNRFEKNQL